MPRTALLWSILYSVGTFGSVAQVYSQAATSNKGSNSPHFEVASVKENKSGSPPSSNVPLDRSDTFFPTACTLRAINQPFVTYLIFAYKVSVSEFRGGLMRSLPSWAVRDRFDIIAKCASPSPSKDDLRLMLQSLLAERFNLEVHRNNRQFQVLAMHPRKASSLGPQLKPHDSSCATPLAAPVLSTPSAELVGRWPQLCGDGEELRLSGKRLREGGRAMNMEQIADWLSGAGDLELPVVNRSGLTGTFDFVLEFVPDKLQDAIPDPADKDGSGPSFQNAVEDQLGIRLKKETASIPLFFVDRVEYPSPN
ncbi:MAG TPA: TIGR03435 family protein [Terracidiphilus sp.]|nr:TIGR03435 family protein [Terracidiphilus sp.]